MRILMESHSTRSEAAGDELDGPTCGDVRAEAAPPKRSTATRASTRVT